MIHVTPYEMPVHINSYQTDSRARLTLSCLFQVFQEAAYRHAQSMGWGFEALKEKNQFWALTRVAVEVERMPLWNEDLIIRTAPGKGEGLMAPRDLLLIDEEGRVCVKCTTYWIIMDMTNRKPILPENFFDGFSIGDDCRLCGLPFKKIRGTFGDEPVIMRSVYFSALDLNNHVNNSVYINFLLDGMNREELEENRIVSFQIIFQQEAGLGDNLAVYRGEDSSGAILLKAVSGETDSVTARLQLAPYRE
ncbi:MAG: hypothetical protein JXA95_01415 [Spirochaetales bacterium]|nr:hypothetical protein [Spirochaetales bacterium]